MLHLQDLEVLRCFWNVRFITLSILPRYTAQMLRRFIPPMLSLWLLFASLAQANATVDKIQIKGLDKGDDVEMMKNITVSLSLYSVVGKEQGESRLEYLLSQAEFQTRQALEPFGYYAPAIRIDAPRQNDHITVVIYVDKGEPVRIRQAHVAMTGAAAQDHYLQRDLEDFKPKLGEIFNHPTYEASKVRITRRLAERGYFDADFTRRQVEVTRATYAADIDLIWESGRRYDMGPVRFHYDYFHEGLFNPLVYWEEGSYFHEGKLDRLRESLTKLDYFSSIDIQPKPEEADSEGNVPVDVKLERAKSKIYTAGISYGSESGAGLRAGVERRYMNARGHKMNARLDYAQNRKSLTTAYQIPAFKWLDGWYIFSARAYDEQTQYIDLRNVKLSAARSGQINRHLTATASLNALRERWRYAADDGTNTVAYQHSTLVYPQFMLMLTMPPSPAMGAPPQCSCVVVPVHLVPKVTLPSFMANCVGFMDWGPAAASSYVERSVPPGPAIWSQCRQACVSLLEALTAFVVTLSARLVHVLPNRMPSHSVPNMFSVLALNMSTTTKEDPLVAPCSWIAAVRSIAIRIGIPALVLACVTAPR